MMINKKSYKSTLKNARKKVLKEFCSNVRVQKYIELYKEILNG